MIGSANAAVFPVPVAACASRSRPANINGMVSRCTGVGSSYPSAVSVAIKASERPREANPVEGGPCWVRRVSFVEVVRAGAIFLVCHGGRTWKSSVTIGPQSAAIGLAHVEHLLTARDAPDDDERRAFLDDARADDGDGVADLQRHPFVDDVFRGAY